MQYDSVALLLHDKQCCEHVQMPSALSVSMHDVTQLVNVEHTRSVVAVEGMLSYCDEVHVRVLAQMNCVDDARPSW